MRSGRLRHRISISGTIETKTLNGEMISAPSPAFKVWSEIMPKSGSLSYIAAQHTEKTTHEIRVRYDDRFASNMNIAYGTRSFLVEATLNSKERNRELILICTECR